MNLAPTYRPQYRENYNTFPATIPMRHRLLPGWLALAALTISAAGAQAQNTFTAQPVGSPSGEQAVVVNSAGGGTVKMVEVLTAGNPNGDFAAGVGPSTCPNATLSPGGSCTEFVTFTPLAPGLRMGAVVLLDSANHVLGATFISGTGQGGLGVLVPGNVVIVAGTADTFSGVFDGGQAVDANLNLPSSVTFDGAGNMYIADSLHNRVRMVCGAATTATIAGTTCSTAGIISTVAGNDTADYTGDGGAASAATVNTPNGVAIDGAGNLYIADTGNNVIRMVSAATGNISTVAGGAGTLCAASTDSVGDNCPANQAKLDQPWGVTLDASGNLYIADTFNHRIRTVSSATGVITTVAGTGFTQSDGSGAYNGDNILATAAELNFPFAVAFDPHGNMYIPDSGNQRVREVLAVGGVITSASQIVTFAGTGTQGGNQGCFAGPLPANQAEFSWPEGVAVDAAGNVYIDDSQNAGVRKVNAATLNLSTLIKSGCGEDYITGEFLSVELYGPKGLYVDGSGNVYVADYYNMVIREVLSNYAAIDDYDPSSPTRQGSTSSPTLQEVENDGNAALDLTSLTAGANTSIDGTVPDACTTGSLAADADCNIGAQFAPAATPVLTYDQDEIGTITVDEDTQGAITAPNNPLTVVVFGTAGPGYGTVTTITSAPNPSAYQQNVTFTVNVTAGPNTGNLNGTVSIVDTYNGATTTLAYLPLTLSATGTTGTATFKISTLGVGQHSIVASYSGDTVHFKSTSTDNGVPPLIQTVQPGSITTLTSSLNPSTVGASVTFTAIVASSPPGVAPNGTVTFMDGTNILGSVTLTTIAGAQQATFTTTTLTNGPHPITAEFGGDATDGIQGSTSNVVTQQVQAPATLSLASNLNPSYFGNSVTFTATISSKATNAATGTVDFFDNGAQIGTGTLTGNPAVATFTTATLGVGTHPITATYQGDGYNTAAQSPAPVNQVVTLDAFNITVTPAALTLKTTTNATVTVSVTSVGDFSDGIIFGCASLPPGVTCEFSPLNANLPANGTVSAQLNIDTNNPLSGGATAMNHSPGSSASLAGLLLPIGGFFGWLFWRQRRRGFGLLAMVLALAISAAALTATGCSGFSLSSAAPGTYTIQVSGTGATSYFTRYQNVTLTITQ
jgi:large repetitive protein